MAKTTKTVEPAVEEVPQTPVVEEQVGATALAQALVAAINATKAPEKKNAFNRKVNTPWTPKDGSPKLKLERKMYQHGILIDPDMCTNKRIELLNKVQPGLYFDGFVKVHKRRDFGIDIDYPIKTPAQRLRLVNQFGIRNFDELLEQCIEQKKNRKVATPEFDEV